MNPPCLKIAVYPKPIGTRKPVESPEEIVRSAQEKFGRDSVSRKAVRMCFGRRRGLNGITQGGETA